MRRYKQVFHIGLIILVSLPLLTGCWDRLDPENMAFVIAIGVDPGPQNDYLFTFALAVPKTPSGGSSGGGQSSDGGPKKTIAVHTVEGSNIASALRVSQSFIARRLTLIHSKAFILGEDMGRKGVMPLLSEAVRNREFRRTVNIITTRGKAETYIQNILPTTEQDISLWFELELDPNNIGDIIPNRARFHEFIVDIENMGAGAITILSAPRPDIKKGSVKLSSENDESDAEASQPDVSKVYAGRLRRKGEVPVEFFGTAVYKSAVLEGFLSGSETRVLNMLRGEFIRSSWDFRDPSNEKLMLSVNMRAEKQCQIKVTRSGDEVTVSFHAAMEGELISVQTPVDYTLPESIEKLEQSIQSQLENQSVELLNKTLRQWGTDCYRINNHVKSTFSTWKEWEAFRWKDRIKDVHYEVETSFKLRGHGGQVGPAIEGDKMH
ncbi:Ger(x)C family spore germination protein [Paenibacillus abyssi]|uniref:Uncharacterized protein n=1 Tax=Paenibacillus abyssi TaxID=1340531 RepID=A0A917FX77_9BACL|nr:Ger(x)C family spore germination C-terminal domain-containing protein [Paenibacillus abyssi]GGG13425.1 hypothetical protein GCM10010916_32930 [Paenibacillus abyssi]